MVSIAADNSAIECSLQKNIDLAEQDGAEFSEELLLRCVEGYFSLEAPPEILGKQLICLPWDCLIPIRPFQLAVAGDDIFISSHEAALSAGCIARMEAVLELFNLANKYAEHRRMSPWSLIASNPELLQFVRQRRGVSIPMFDRLIASGDEDALMLQTFIGSRAYNFALETGHSQPNLVLMPILDMMNHHIYGSPYRGHHKAASRALTMSRSAPLAANECFACYGPYDSFDTWLSYDFIDGVAPFVCSVAITIELRGLGTIRAGKLTKPRVKIDLPDPVKDLWFYIPKLLARNGNHIEVASLLIPGPQSPRALRRTLRFLITEISPNYPCPNDLVLHAEEQIIAANRTYYSNLLAVLEKSPPKGCSATANFG